MKEIYIPMHLDSGNRGCEGITKGTSAILLSDDYHIKAYTRNIELDKNMEYKIDIKELVQYSFIHKFFFKIRKKLIYFMPYQKTWIIEHTYKNMLKDIDLENDNPIALLTGGDLFCYDYSEIVWLNDYLCNKKIRTVLWGCSIGEKNLTPEKIETLKRFSIITARESKTANMLKETLKLQNVWLFPDPAFVVEPLKCSVPVYFNEKDIVGINLSNFVNCNVGSSTIFGKNISNLFDYIINQTDMDIMLVPHVFWKGQDDRKVCNRVYAKYRKSGRVHLLDSEKLNYCQIRYLISLCRFFIGARTHAVISAYSTCVPVLALGYSVKSEGIARDIGMPEQLVVNYKNMKLENELIKAFKYLINNEDGVRKRLNDIMPKYRQAAYESKTVLEKGIG